MHNGQYYILCIEIYKGCSFNKIYVSLLISIYFNIIENVWRIMKKIVIVKIRYHYEDGYLFVSFICTISNIIQWYNIV